MSRNLDIIWEIWSTMKLLIDLSVLLFLFSISYTDGFYVPGTAPQDFAKGDLVEVKAVKLLSTKTQLPYEYYNLPIHCKPESGVKYKSENLGEILRGDRVVNTGFNIKMNVDEKCKVICSNVTLNKEESNKLIKRIKDDYHVHLLVDNLPAATKFLMMDTKEERYEHGYKLGFTTSGEHYLNNHIKFVLKYHAVDMT